MLGMLNKQMIMLSGTKVSRFIDAFFDIASVKMKLYEIKNTKKFVKLYCNLFVTVILW